MKNHFGLRKAESFVCRIPNRSFEEYNIPEDDSYSMNEYIHQKISDNYIQLAVYLASPVLYAELKAFEDKEYYKNIPAKKLRSIYCSFISYINRLSTRSTPFGLFSSTLNGEVSNSTDNNEAVEDGSFRLSIELDGKVLHNIAQKLLEDYETKKNTVFYTNNTFFKFGEKLNYIEYTEKAKRDFNVSSIIDSDDINEILKFCKDGKTYSEIGSYLVGDGYNPESIDETIDVLITNKIVISELEPDVVGQTYHNQIADFVTKHNDTVDERIKDVFNAVAKLSYENISVQTLEIVKNKINEIITPSDSSYFSINSFSNEVVKIEDGVSEEIDKGFRYFLSYCNKKSDKEREINEWIHNFVLKFDGQFIPLKKALDPEAGCYYSSDLNFESFDQNSIVDKLPLDYKSKSSISKRLDKIDEYILKETVNCVRDNKIEISVPNELLETNIDYNALPPTLNAMCLIGEKDGVKTICYSDALSDSAATLLGRFTPFDKGIKKLSDSLAHWEQEKLHSCMVCEFSHVTNYEDCNIMARNIDRKYVIPFLTHVNGTESTEVLNFEDVYVGIYENRIVFFDMQKKKQIIPVMSHSHNYGKELLPIYKFVGDVQMHNCSGPRYFGRDNTYIKQIFGFQPRIRYGNYLFSLAKWVIKSAEIRPFFSLDIDSRIEKMKEYLKGRNIPMEFSIVSGDMKLYINLDTLPVKSIILIEKSITNKSTFEIEENFYSEYSSIVKRDEDKTYGAEFVFPFLNDEAKYNVNTEKDNNYIYNGFTTNMGRIFKPNDEWVYFKIYCEYSVSDKIISQNLVEIKDELYNKGLIDKWHFLRYKDMQGHQIRMRYHLKDSTVENAAEIYKIVKQSLCKYTIDEIPTIKIDTYTREIERYGANVYDAIERIFCVDSDMHCKVLSSLVSNDDTRLLFGLYLIKKYVDVVYHTPEAKLAYVTSRVNEMAKDYEGGKAQRVYLNKKYHTFSKSMEDFFDSMDGTPITSIFQDIDNIYNCNSIPEEILPLLIHMSLDRLYKSRNRLNEYAGYSLMERYYKKMVFNQN